MPSFLSSSTVNIGTLTSGALPVVESFATVIMLTLGISLGIFGIAFIISTVARTLATANQGVGSTQRNTKFGRH